jgi:hypothetical protein
MAENNQVTNKDAIKALIDSANLPIIDIPIKLAQSIVPIIDITPVAHRVVNIGRSTATTSPSNSTIYTTPTDRDFYLTGAILTASYDATADNTFTHLQTYVNGYLFSILEFRKISLTAFSDNTTISFPTPIKLDRGATIVLSGSFNVGSGTKGAAIFGYVVDTQQK